MYKMVLMPLEVSAGDFCWNGKDICSHFDSEGGHPTCDFDLGDLKYNKHAYVEKPDKCLNLEDKCQDVK